MVHDDHQLVAPAAVMLHLKHSIWRETKASQNEFKPSIEEISPLT